MAYLTTKQAAERRGVHRSRILALINEGRETAIDPETGQEIVIKQGRLPAIKPGNEWLIEDADLDNLVLYRHGYPAGKPRRTPDKEDKEAAE